MKIRSLFILLVGTILFQACATGSAEEESVKPINVKDYEFFTEEYKGDAAAAEEAGFVLTEIYNKSFEEKYLNEPANYKVKGFEAKRNNESMACAIIVELKVSRKQSSLLGAAKPINETKYFCLPSSKASTSLHNKNMEAVKAMGYKDMEVYITALSSMFSDTYMK